MRLINLALGFHDKAETGLTKITLLAFADIARPYGTVHIQDGDVREGLDFAGNLAFAGPLDGTVTTLIFVGHLFDTHGHSYLPTKAGVILDKATNQVGYVITDMSDVVLRQDAMQVVQTGKVVF